METSLKTGFAQFSIAAQKNLSCPKFWGGCSPPGPYAYVYVIKVIKTENLDVDVYVILLPKRLKRSCYTTRWRFSNFHK